MVLPHSKQRGTYPVFVFGGVGLNMKTELHIFESGKTVTAAIYHDVLRNVVVPLKQKNTPQQRYKVPDMYMTQDNDPKHYNEISKSIQAQHGIKLLAIQRKDTKGNVDVAPGRGGHMVRQGIAFPAYSPDINGPIEKVWRELQKRVVQRANEISSRAEMVQVIKEEWDALPFEQDGSFIGINGYVRMHETVLKEVINEKGWDTRYMK